MKLLLDENLSFRLVRRIEDLFPGTEHVATFRLLQAPDQEVWEFARHNGFCIVSADVDFYQMSLKFGPPPKVIWLLRCDYPTHIAETIIRAQAIRIADFLKDEERGFLVLQRNREA